jgi:hypothetical protein
VRSIEVSDGIVGGGVLVGPDGANVGEGMGVDTGTAIVGEGTVVGTDTVFVGTDDAIGGGLVGVGGVVGAGIQAVTKINAQKMTEHFIICIVHYPCSKSKYYPFPRPVNLQGLR